MQIHAAIYLRVSQDHEMDGRAIDRHRQECMKILGDRGWTLHREYVDQSISATDRYTRRPSYEEMVADYQAGKFSAIICWDLDRLTRQPRQLEDWIDAAAEHGLKLITANGEADLSTDGGRMFARMKAAVARSEVERKGARQRSAQAQRARQGRAPKGIRPIGYALNGDVVPQEAEVVEQVFNAFLAGASLKGIARALSGIQDENAPANIPAIDRHTRTLAIERNARREAENKLRGPADQLVIKPVPEKKPWDSSSVLMILRNPRYAGYSTYTPKKQSKGPDGTVKPRRSHKATIVRDEHGEPVYGLWDPIVDENKWWSVQEILDDPSRTRNRHSTERKHIGSGLFLCGVCGAKVRAHSSRYRCVGHIMRSREQIEKFVLTAVRARLGQSDLMDLMPSRNDPRLTELKAEIDEHRGRIRRAQSDYDEEIIEGRDLKRIRDKEEARIAVLEAERNQLTSAGSTSGVLRAEDPVAAFDAADLGTRRTVIDALCTVTLHPHPRGKKTFNPETVELVWR